jgi:hypothetical protein
MQPKSSDSGERSIWIAHHEGFANTLTDREFRPRQKNNLEIKPSGG